MQKNLFARSFHFVKSTGENKFFFCGVYRTSLVKNIIFHNSWGGDHLFLYEALSKGKFLYVPGLANFYYARGGSSTGTESVRKAFGIKNKYYFFDAYILRYTTYQFRFRHIGFLKKLGLFFSNWAGLVCNEDFILYYIFIKKPIKSLWGLADGLARKEQRYTGTGRRFAPKALGPPLSVAPCRVGGAAETQRLSILRAAL